MSHGVIDVFFIIVPLKADDYKERLCDCMHFQERNDKLCIHLLNTTLLHGEKGWEGGG